MHLHECIIIFLNCYNIFIPGKMIQDNKLLTSCILTACGLGPVGFSEVCDAEHCADVN